MFKSKKLLIIDSILILILGLSIFWAGIQSKKENPPTSTPIEQKTSDEATASAIPSIDGEKALVSKVVDGDTLELADGRTVRFVGIDTPETVDPRRPVGCFGKEASAETKKLLSGKEIILKKDVSEKDKYGRILRYIYLPLEDGQTLFVNDYLVREGYALVYTYPPDVKFNEQFREAEKQARENKRGLWGKC